MSSVEFAEIENIIVVQVDEFFFVAFELKILTCLQQVEIQVHQNTKLLQALHKKADTVELPEERDRSIFPLKTKAGLEELEEHLKIAEFSQLVSIKMIFIINSR